MIVIYFKALARAGISKLLTKDKQLEPWFISENVMRRLIIARMRISWNANVLHSYTQEGPGMMGTSDTASHDWQRDHLNSGRK